jgi:hypothetical protein
MNVRPISVDEAPFRPNRLKRSGRQRGGWVYLPEELLRSAGVGPGDEVEVMRYALVERTRRANGSERVRGRVILNLRLLDQHTRRKEAPR